MKKILICLALLAGANAVAQNTQTVNLSTGVDSGGNLMPIGANDDDWYVLPNGSSTWYNTVTSLSYCTSCSRTSFAPADEPGGNTIFRLNFTLAHPVSCITGARVIFSYINADDRVDDFKINNPNYTYTFSPTPGFSSPNVPSTTTFTVTIASPASVFTNGTNFIDFDVMNSPSLPTSPVCLSLCAKLEIDYDATGPAIPYFAVNTNCQNNLNVIGSATNDPGITGYIWGITECDASGTPTGGLLWFSSAYSGFPGSYTFPPAPTGPALVCNKYYKISLGVVNTCSNTLITNSQVILLNCPPVANAGPDQTICNEGGCVTLNGNVNGGIIRGVSYSWSGPGGVIAGTKTVTVCPTETTTYCVTATSASTGCTSTDCITVNVEHNNPDFALTASPADPTYQTFTATPVQTTGLPAGFGFMWFIDELDASNNIVYTVNSSNTSITPCWWTFPSAEVFDGCDWSGSGTPTLNGSCTPSTGHFKYNTKYRITRGVWSTSCPWKQMSYDIYTAKSISGAIITPDRTAPDRSNTITGIETHLAPASGSEDLLTVYPNPSTGTVSIDYFIGTAVKGKIAITNLLGETVKIKEISAGQNTIMLDLNDQPNGIYFVNLYATDQLIRTEKIVLNH